MTRTEPDQALPAQIDNYQESLVVELAGIFPPETVERYVSKSRADLSDARVVNVVPILFDASPGQSPGRSAQAEGGIMNDVPEVLFVCIHNAGRSQMAAALLDHHAHGRVHVRSGGSAPGDSINPAVAEAMAEVGLDLSKAFPKPVTDEAVRAADVVITMGCGDACPIYPGKRYEDWALNDPKGRSVEEVRPIRDEIDQRVQALLVELTASAT
jgi:protein-tyrosine-phosphatase